MGDGPAIELTGLTKRYGPVVGVDRLSLTVRPGEVFGFLGPNGAGKTTTLRCLTGLLRPSEGRVRVLGLDPVTDHRRVAPHLGYLPGELRFYPELSGAETLDLLSALQGAAVPRRGELCDRLGLTHAILTRPVGGYSRGMKQKLGLVQALQHDPPLVVLDEPTEGLDPLVQETFFALLQEAAAAGRTVLLSSHLRFLSPFHYYTPGDALAQGGVLWPRLGILVGAGVLGLAFAHLAMQRRDLAP
ncbi:ABC transporter ATP-binding protein [Streptomyces sp. NPDC056491]|uniref:ABC transporter ATP-binding protein n=1 Tax=Streptomyces sp. NPDC056491 TaxID=3345837 RepID=UPI0036ACDE96